MRLKLSRERSKRVEVHSGKKIPVGIFPKYHLYIIFLALSKSRLNIQGKILDFDVDMSLAHHHPYFYLSQPNYSLPCSPSPLLHFKFESFAHLCNALCSDTGSSVFSEYQRDCNGNAWRLQLYPNDRSVNEGFISLYLCSGNKHIITCSFDLGIS